MDPFTIGLILSAVGGGIQIAGNVKQGQYERAQAEREYEIAKRQQQWQREEMDWNIEDAQRQKESAVGTLLTNTAALGIAGPSIDQAKGTTIGEYNRAISRIETQKDWTREQDAWMKENLDMFKKQSRANQTFSNVSTLLTTGSNMAFGYYQYKSTLPPKQKSFYNARLVDVK